MVVETRPFTWKGAELGWESRKNTNLAQIPLIMREKGTEATLLHFLEP